MCEHPIPCLDERSFIFVRLCRAGASSQGGTALVRAAAVGSRATQGDPSSEGRPQGDGSGGWYAACAPGSRTLDPAAPHARHSTRSPVRQDRLQLRWLALRATVQTSHVRQVSPTTVVRRQNWTDRNSLEATFRVPVWALQR